MKVDLNKFIGISLFFEKSKISKKEDEEIRVLKKKYNLIRLQKRMEKLR